MPLKVMVLSGGPDQEHPISLQSGAAVEQALRQAGHHTQHCQIAPNQLEAIDLWYQWDGDVAFPVLHGPWGEGGPLQSLLDEHDIPYVGCHAKAAELCMDKYRTKQILLENGLMTPTFQLVKRGESPSLHPPVVIKPPREGSSIDLAICHRTEEVHDVLAQLNHYPTLLVERYVPGKEMTVGVVVHDDDELQVLPPIQIIPNRQYFDFEAKYERDDTHYLLDPQAIALPGVIVDQLGQWAATAHRALGCRHVSRTDFIVDCQNQPWILEVNTMPGFTNHSLLPKAAAHAGLSLPRLVDRLVRSAARCHGQI